MRQRWSRFIGAFGSRCNLAHDPSFLAFVVAALVLLLIPGPLRTSRRQPTAPARRASHARTVPAVCQRESLSGARSGHGAHGSEALAGLGSARGGPGHVM